MSNSCWFASVASVPLARQQSVDLGFEFDLELALALATHDVVAARAGFSLGAYDHRLAKFDPFHQRTGTPRSPSIFLEAAGADSVVCLEELQNYQSG